MKFLVKAHQKYFAPKITFEAYSKRLFKYAMWKFRLEIILVSAFMQTVNRMMTLIIPNSNDGILWYNAAKHKNKKLYQFKFSIFMYKAIYMSLK